MKGLYISNVPASYREDLCTELRNRLGFTILHYGDDPIFRNRLGKTFISGLDHFLMRMRPEVVITSEFSPVTLQFLSRRSRYGYKVIVLCDDSLDMIQGNDFSWTHRMARLFVPRHIDEIILHSPGVRDWYRDRYRKGLFMPILSDERRVRPALEEALPLTRQIRLSRKPVVAFVGRFVDLKNIPVLIEAFRPFQGRAQLVLIGDGPQRHALEKMAPDALFTGFQTGRPLLAWYNLMDVLVLPSTQEAYGAVVGEALMAGAKVVVSRKAGSSDLVREGENGYLIDPMDVAGLTDRIGRLLETVPSDRPSVLRKNLLPYRFEDCINRLIQEILAL